MTDRPTLELVAQDAYAVHVASSLGIERVELCSALELGGLTPSAGLVGRCVDVARAADPGVEVHALIRPRPGDFRFDDDEMAIMVADIASSVAAGAAGVVVGALAPDGLPDLGVLARFVEAAAGAEVTFHRALDVSADPVAALERVAGAGVTRVLSSGGRPTAEEGMEVLRRMVGLGLPVQVMAGSGVNAGNARQLAATGVAALHFSARTRVAGSGMALGAGDDGGHDVTDADAARAIVEALTGSLGARS